MKHIGRKLMSLLLTLAMIIGLMPALSLSASATVDGSISYAVTEVKKHLGVDDSFTIDLTLTGDGTVTYSSSDENVATVNEETGEVTLAAAGTAVITATVTNTENYIYTPGTASYTLNVWEARMISAISGSADPVPAGTTVYTSTWSVQAYFAAAGTQIPEATDPPFDFAGSADWDVIPLTSADYTVDGTLNVESVTVTAEKNSFVIAFGGQTTEVTIPLSPYTLTAVSASGEVIFSVDDPPILVESAIAGQTVTMTVTPDTGYSINAVSVKQGSDDVAVSTVSDGVYTFTMPEGDVTATVTYVETVYGITNSGAEHGSYTFLVNGAEVSEAAPGSAVIVSVTPDEGYLLASITVTKTEDPEVAVDDFGNGFIMPDYPVTVAVTIIAMPSADETIAWKELNTTNYPAGSTLYTGRYYLTADASFDGSNTGNGLKIASGAIVYIYLNGHTLSAAGKAANGMTGGFAGIFLPESATLYFVGDGAVSAVGGAAAAGGNGSSGANGYAYASFSGGINGYLGGVNISSKGGAGGAGGNGGGGAGAGIGTNGASGVSASGSTSVNVNTGSPANAGTVSFLGSVNIAGTSGGAKAANGSTGSNGSSARDKDSKNLVFTTLKCSASGGGGAGGSGGQGGSAGAIIGAGGAGGNGGAKGGNGSTKRSTDSHSAYNSPASVGAAAGTNSASSANSTNEAVQYYLKGINVDTTAANNLFAVGTTITGAENDVLDKLTVKAYYSRTAADTMNNYGGTPDSDWTVIDIPQALIRNGSDSTQASYIGVWLTNQTSEDSDGALVAGGNNILVTFDAGANTGVRTAELNAAGIQTNTQFLGAAGKYKNTNTVKHVTYDNELHCLTDLNDFSDCWNATYAVLYTPYNKFTDNKVTSKAGAATTTFLSAAPQSNADNWLLGGADTMQVSGYFAEAGKYFNGTAYANAAAYSSWVGNYADLSGIRVKNAGLYTVYERVLNWNYNATGLYTANYTYNTYYILIEQADLGIDQATDTVYESTKVQDHVITRFVEGKNNEQVYGTFSFDASYGALWGNNENLMVNQAAPLQSGLQWEFNVFGSLTSNDADKYTDFDRATISYGSKNINNYLCQNDGQSAVTQQDYAGSDVRNTYYSADNGILSYRNPNTDPDPAPDGVNVIPAAMSVTANYVGEQNTATADNAKKTEFTTKNYSSLPISLANYPYPTYADRTGANTLTSVYAEDLKISAALTTEGIGWRVVAGDKISGDTAYGTHVTAAPNADYTEDLITEDAYRGDLYVITVKAGDEVVLFHKYTDTTATNTVANVLSTMTELVYDELPACEYSGVEAYEVTVEYFGLYYTTETSTNGRKPGWSGEEEFQWVVSGVRFYLDVEQREVALKDTADFDKIYDGTTKLVSQTLTDGDVTAAAKYIISLDVANEDTQFAHKPVVSLYNYLDPTADSSNMMHLELAADYDTKDKGAGKSLTVAAARFLAVDDAVPAAGDKVAALNYKLVDGNGETDGLAALTGDVDVANLHFTHGSYGSLTVYDLTPMHEVFDIHAKAYLLTAAADDDGFYPTLSMALTELVEKDDAKGGMNFQIDGTDYDYAISYAINTSLMYDQYMTDKTLVIDNATGAVTHVAERTIGSTNPANFPAINVTIADFKNFTLVTDDAADVNLNACERQTALNTKTSSAESWKHIMRFKVKGNSNNYDLLLPEDQLNARPVLSVFVNRSGGTVADEAEAEHYKYVSVYPNGDSVLFDFTIPQNSYLEDVKIAAVKVGDSDYKTYENATTAIPTFETLSADTENLIGSFLTQADMATGMNNIKNPVYLKLVQVNGKALSNLTAADYFGGTLTGDGYNATALADANEQVGGSTFRFEFSTGACALGENYAIVVLPVIKEYTSLVEETPYQPNLSVEQKITGADDATLISGTDDSIYVNYKTLFDTSAYGSDAANGDGYLTMSYLAPDADGVINSAETAATKQWQLGANTMGKFNSFAIATEADATTLAFFDPAKLLPGTEVTVTISLWRNGVLAGVQTSPDADAFSTTSFTWTISEEEYFNLFLDDAVILRSSKATTDCSNILGYLLSSAPANVDFSSAVFYTNHAADMTEADEEWSVQSDFDLLTAFADTWYKTDDTQMVISASTKMMAGLAVGDNLYPTYEYAKLQRVTTTNGTAADAIELGYARVIFGQIDLSDAFVYANEADAQTVAPFSSEAYTGAVKTAFADTADLYWFDGWYSGETVACASAAGTITASTQSYDVYTIKEHINYVTFKDGASTVGYGILDTGKTTVASELNFAEVPFTTVQPAIGTANTAAAKNMTFEGEEAFAKNSYLLNGWHKNDSAFTDENKVDLTAAVPAVCGDVFYLNSTFNGSVGGGVAPATKYAPVIEDTDRITMEPEAAAEGEQVTITVTPDAGYVVDKVTVKDADGNDVEVTKIGPNTYVFTQPDCEVTIEATFLPETWFIDVPLNSYYCDAVKWAVDNGITTGTSETTFSPNASCTRAEMVTFLWRAAGMPEPETTECAFVDVKENAYYYKAVLWAAENDIARGTSATTFRPNDIVSRGQAVTFLFRALNGTAGENNPFTDVKSNAFYFDAVLWAVESDITRGTSATTFRPADDCLRAQIVTFLFRAYNKQ